MGNIAELDILNRALQKVGKPRIGSLLDLTPQAQEIAFAYPILRRAEMRRNPWVFSIRNVALRALDQYMQQPVFAAWAVGTTYAQNDIAAGSDGQIYLSRVASNTGNDPTTSPSQWTLYFGPLLATPFASAWANGDTYAQYDIVTGSDANYYQSIAGSNTGNNPVGDNNVHWLLLSVNSNTGKLLPFTGDTGLSFYAGEIVFAAGSVYVSLISGNETDPTTDTTGSWLALTARPAMALLNFIYPIGAGPSTQLSTRNVFMLPNGYLRQVPQAPKDPFGAFLGGPSALRSDDFNFENACFTSYLPGPIVFRFAADIADASLFDPLFIEAMAFRLALELAPTFDIAEVKIARIERQYKKFMGEARTVDGIEAGPVEPPIDEYIAVRQ